MDLSRRVYGGGGKSMEPRGNEAHIGVMRFLGAFAILYCALKCFPIGVVLAPSVPTKSSRPLCRIRDTARPGEATGSRTASSKFGSPASPYGRRASKAP